MTSAIKCGCAEFDATYQQFRLWRSLPDDKTDGRHAEVEIKECVTCGKLWLRYAVEYPAFSYSGRWARGEITPELAAVIEPEEAADFLAKRPSIIYGGSFYGGVVSEKSGPLYWG
ncbi:hypothetical protein [Asticcacaulis sp. AC402]|uniref:hypothetical protein n=1 Tax=Asticcacaulis sp. AC402 TaxID=1282361 RepID=UPI0003C3AD0A|nr:hypothetical protein [Asticcacaulis sp. AC402]ESQ73504.1 hypothetical protein ABAC402_18885 [Asticcacaulis sp. AC402]